MHGKIRLGLCSIRGDFHFPRSVFLRVTGNRFERVYRVYRPDGGRCPRGDAMALGGKMQTRRARLSATSCAAVAMIAFLAGGHPAQAQTTAITLEEVTIACANEIRTKDDELLAQRRFEVAPRATTAGGYWRGMSDVSAHMLSADHVGGHVYWFACRKPSGVTEAKFVRGMSTAS